MPEMVDGQVSQTLPCPCVLQKRHKEELERRLAEIEDARRIFSRPNVLVQANT